ncbi:MAG TPA: glycosyltransferase family 39 protein [Candidatus Omnitrophota bacterium]|mgnify:CR=1 FL=1|nr:glycosyltransferase family 39 protein [Candidatus Omnitrophota bacterium]HPT07331.1 glycosyltransferase family 39 protein [Candidatus Omnitrophota bacterium]
MSLRSEVLRKVLLVLVLSYVFFFLGNGVLNFTNPDEVFYSQTAKEMMKHNSWQTPYLFDKPQFEKPIMTYWLLRIAFEVGGVTPFAARFFPALFATIGIVAIYFFGIVAFRNTRKAFLSALVMMSSAFYIGLARTVFTDMIFTVFILLSMLSFYWAYTNPHRKTHGIIWFFIFAALATLTKGPLGIGLPVIAVIVFLALRKELSFVVAGATLWGALLFCMIAVPWYALMIKWYGHDFTHEFFYNDHWRRLIEAEHRKLDHWHFYPVSTIGAFFPWSLFLLSALFFYFKDLWRKKGTFFVFAGCWIGVMFVLFQCAHSKLLSYIFPFFPALALITGNFLAEQEDKKGKLIFVLSLITAVFLTILPLGLVIAAHQFPQYIPSAKPIYFFAIVLLLYAAVTLRCVIRRNFVWFNYLVSLILPLLVGCAFVMANTYDVYISSKQPAEFLLKNYRIHGKILCSKKMARGVRFYTDKDVAIEDINGEGYFSEHPVIHNQTVDEARAFLASQPETYCILGKSDACDLRDSVAGLGFRVEFLKIFGQTYVVRITKK